MGQWDYIADQMGMSLKALNDPLIAVRIQREITLKRPPEFSYLSSYAPMSQKRRQQAESNHSHVFAPVPSATNPRKLWRISTAMIAENEYSVS